MTASPSWLAERLLDRGWLPDRAIRAGIRRLVAARLREEDEPDPARAERRLRSFAAERSAGPVAIDTRAANDQHYEVPTAFYRLVLGRHLKYSCAWWGPGIDALDDAEAAMLALTCERAGLVDGQAILELGCGWGSLALWMARRYPRAQITSVSNSATQKAWIDARIAQDDLRNLTIVTADMNVFETRARFDRVVSVEMFEHMRNWKALLARIDGWLEDDGALFIHIFTHRRYAYPYEAREASDWMARYFFTGGIMPADRLLYEFEGALEIRDHWQVDGTHYQRTAEAWLANLDRHRAEALPILEEAYGRADARRWLSRWRAFFMACAELWGWDEGREWLVSHYRLVKR